MIDDRRTPELDTTTQIRSDEFGRPVADSAADESSEPTAYDACGNAVELVDAEGGLTRLARDLAYEDEMTDNSASASSPSKRKSSGWVRFGVSASIFVVLILLLYIGPLVLQRYDSVHRSLVSCTVTKATALTGSSVSRTGLGWSNPEVVIETKSCGTLLLRSGVTDENRSDIAKHLEAGRHFEMEVGSGTFRLRKLFNFFHRDPTVYSYREN